VVFCVLKPNSNRNVPLFERCIADCQVEQRCKTVQVFQTKRFKWHRRSLSSVCLGKVKSRLPTSLREPNSTDDFVNNVHLSNNLIIY
jgi:hypothetical protein